MTTTTTTRHGIHRKMMIKPQWIGNTYIGPFWMGSSQEIASTQQSIDEATHEQEDENTSTEIGETHYDRQ